MAYPVVHTPSGDYGYGQISSGSIPSKAVFGQKFMDGPSYPSSPPAESSANFPVVLGWILVGGGSVFFVVVVIIAIVLIVKYCTRKNSPQAVQSSTEQYPPGHIYPGHVRRPPQYVYPKNVQLNEYDYPDHFIRPDNFVLQQAHYPSNSIRRPEHYEQLEMSNRPGLPQHLEAPKSSGESEVAAHLDNRLDPIYESIPDYERVKASVSETRAAEMCLRPPCPLPPDVLAQSGRYIHYDTPYEDRIFRLGRLRCQRNPNGGGHVVMPEPQYM